MEKISSKKQFFIKLAQKLEILLAIVVMLVVILGIVDMLRIIWSAYIADFNNPVDYEQLNNILGHILMLVIGVELVIMLCLHKPVAVLEVLLYAIARKLLLIPKDHSMFDLVLGVVAIGGIFAIKKYLVKREVEDNLLSQSFLEKVKSSKNEVRNGTVNLTKEDEKWKIKSDDVMLSLMLGQYSSEEE